MVKSITYLYLSECLLVEHLELIDRSSSSLGEGIESSSID